MGTQVPLHPELTKPTTATLCRWKLSRRWRGMATYSSCLTLNQAVYGFRGSQWQLAGDFAKSHDAKQFVLARNYRSLAHVVELYKQVITGAPSAPQEFIDAIEHVREGEGTQEFHCFDSASEEAAWVVGSIVEHRDPDTAILYRTNAQAGAIEEALYREGVPFVVRGGISFFARREIKAAMNFLRLVENEQDDEALESAILGPWECSKYLGRAFVASLKESRSTGLLDALAAYRGKRWQESAAENLLEKISEIRHACSKASNLGEQIRQISMRVGIVEALRRNDDLEDADNLLADNIEQLAKAAEGFDGTRAEFLTHAEEVVAWSDVGGGTVAAPIRLSTIHRAKGLEFNTVYAVGCNHGILPHYRGDSDEEQRLAYVMVSRAKDHLYVSCYGDPSVFFAGRWPE